MGRPARQDGIAVSTAPFQQRPSNSALPTAPFQQRPSPRPHRLPRAPLTLDLLPDLLSVCRFPAHAAVPAWALEAPFSVVARTRDELSVTCASARVPRGGAAGGPPRENDGWRALQLAGPFDFDAVGVLLGVAAPLAAAGVSILPVATFDTDYVLVRGAQLGAALAALREAGHEVRGGAPA